MIKSMFYEPCCQILKDEAPSENDAKSAAFVTRHLIETEPDLQWSKQQGPVRAMLLSAAARENTPIRKVESSGTPRFYYAEMVATRPTNPVDTVEATPEEIMDQAYAQAYNTLKKEILEKIHSMQADSFEELVNHLISEMGFGHPETTKSTRDGGIDGFISGDKLGINVIGVQSKCYTDHRVSSDDIQKFAGALDGSGCHAGIFVTSSDFSTPAKQEVERMKKVRIRLINGEQLVNFMIEHNVGVQETKKKYILKSIDLDFLNEM